MQIGIKKIAALYIALFTLNGLDVTIQTNSDVFPVVGDRFAAEQM